MKKLLTLTTIAIAALALASCQQEKAYDLAPGETYVKASRELSTRSFLEAETSGETTTYTVFWDVSDQILVTYAGATPGKFTSTNEAPATEATFKGVLPLPLSTPTYGIYPAESGNLVDAEGKFQIKFHDEQTAVENSYDPMASPAVAVSESKDLTFYNVCGLLALRVAYDDVTKITLERGYEGEIIDEPIFSAPAAEEGLVAVFPAGTLTVEMSGSEPAITDATDGVSSITLLPPSGEEYFSTEATYYMAVPPGSIPEGVTFLVSTSTGDIPFIIESEVAVERAKVHEVAVFDGPRPAPAAHLEFQWSMKSAEGSPWTNQITAISATHPDGYGMVRSIAMDDEWIYLPKSSQWGAIAAVSIADPTVQKKLSVSGIEETVPFSTSCVRMIKNSDPAFNDGKDILLVCNVTDATSTYPLAVYAYVNGTDSAPKVLCKFAYDAANDIEDWRRYGDRFYVSGTWQDGQLYFPSFHANKSVIISVANGERTGVTQITAPDLSPEGIKDITVYPGGEEIMLHNNAIYNIISATGNKVNGWDEYELLYAADWAQYVWGIQFFTFNGYKLFADTYVAGGSTVEVWQDKGSLVSSLSSTTMVDDFSYSAAGGSSSGDTAVHESDGETYIASMTRDGGLALFKLVMDEEGELTVDEPKPAKKHNHR